MLKKIWLWFLIIGSGTIIDWIVHTSFPQWSVPFSYFPNKIIFGVLWGMIFSYFIQSVPVSLFWRSIIAPFLVAVALQTKYFLQGYDIYFVILFLFLHFMMFLPASIYIFRKYEKELSF